ncbi:MAG: J domain-containing protein [Cyclobacteriaceae bacterium]|nr:J domain-containing protein [Cyclobacteriaceae bacterium]
MKNYYFILGLTTNAREDEIKHAYRKLALQFHPDKNPSREAAAIFIEINEAYEILSDPQLKFQYDQLLTGAPATAHRDPRYRPRPPGSYSGSSRKKEILEFMQANLKYALMVSRIALLFSAVLIADYTFPPDKIKREVVNLELKRELRDRSIQLNLEDGESVTLNPKTALEFRQGSSITIYSSMIFSVPMILENEQTHFKTKILLSIYGNFSFIPLVLLITSLLGTFYWKGTEFRFNLGVVNFFLILLCFFFLQIHNF